MAELPAELYTLALLILFIPSPSPPHSISSPLCEPQAEAEPRGDFSLNQLCLPTIIQQANNGPSLWETIQVKCVLRW